MPNVQIRRWMIVPLVLLASAGIHGTLLAQVPLGNVSGQVRDQATGRPVVGARITVDNVAPSASTDRAGGFTLTSVPAGMQVIRARRIGYAPGSATVNVPVNGSAAAELELRSEGLVDTVTVVSPARGAALARAAAPGPDTARPDPWTSWALGADVLRSLPVDSLRDALALLPGVYDGGDERGPRVRGAPAGETSVYLDGVWLRNLDSGRPSLLRIEPREVASLALRPSFGAERGGARAAVIELESPLADARWRGDAAFQTDQVTIGAGYGYSRADVYVGGPLAGERLSLSFAGTAVGREDARPTFAPEELGRVTLPLDGRPAVSAPVGPTRWFRQTGTFDTFAVPGGSPINLHHFEEITGLDGRKPFNNGDEYAANLVLRAAPTEGTMLRLGLTASRDQRRFLVPAFAFRPQSLPARREKSYLLRAELSQRLGRSGVLRLLAGVLRDEAMEGFLGETLADTAAVLRGGAYPMAGDALGFTFADFHFPFEKTYTVARWMERYRAMQTDPSLSYLRAFGTLIDPATGAPYTELKAANLFQGWTSPDNPYGIPEFLYSGFGGFASSRERTLFARGELGWAAGRGGRLSVGAEVYRKHVEHLGDTSPGRSINSLATSSVTVEAYEAHPTIVGAWASDRVEIGPAILDAGVRLDGFSSDVAYPTIPGFVFATFSAFTGETITPTFIEPDAEWHLSPRVAVTASLRPRTRLRASVGGYTQIVPLEALYAGVNIDLDKTNHAGFFGRPIGMPRVLAFELGLTQSVGVGTTFELDGYYRDRRRDPTVRVIDAVYPAHGVGHVPALANGRMRERGVEGRATQRLGRVASIQANYGFVAVGGIAEGGFTDHIHAVAATATLRTPADVLGERALASRVLGDLDISLTFHGHNGLPYTRSSTPGATALFPPPGGTFLEPLNASRLPWIYTLDGRVGREVRIGSGKSLVAYVDGRNLLNRQNVLDLFSGTGSPVDPGVTFVAMNTAEASRIPGQDVVLADMPAQNAADVTRQALFQRREQLFGNGDGVFTVEEQARSSLASFLATGWSNERLPAEFFGTPRQVRVGIEWRF
ncbi:MAG TPA: TonB-dependent receptor [Longimicrobiales bacterium]|nr:TonB-dependent receptor [Longimicrobiales bacterium]